MSRIKAGIYGLCVADALGVPAEGRTREDLKKDPITEMTGGGRHGQPAGYWSDDSSMTLCLAKSIGEVGFYHTHDIMARFDDWCRNGAYSPGGKKFDIGNTCSHAVSRYRKGCTPALCGSNKQNENGNGSLMRILPMAYVLYGKYGKDITKHKKAMEDIHKISGLTHRHPLAQSACGIYLAAAVRLLDGYGLREAIQEGTRAALDWYGAHQRFSACVDEWERLAAHRFRWEKEETVYSGGYVVESLEAAFWCLLNTKSYRECVLRCVNMGYDADSTAAIAGGLAGIYYGYDSIPGEWIARLAGKDIIDDCIAGLERYCRENNIHSFKTHWDYNWIRHSNRDSVWNTELDRKARQADLDKFLGCLIGGAAGDALGYPVEFLSEKWIRTQFGADGITGYRYKDGLARISDDTQMTLFTANGLLYGETRYHIRGIMGYPRGYVAAAYREWYKTQLYSKPHGEDHDCWLMQVPGLYAQRAPGNTCMSAIDEGCHGDIETPVNDSKGCGGVMRVTPVGLFYGQSHWTGMAVDLLAADIAALTHGHEMGYIPAALLAHIVRLVSHSHTITLKEAVLDGCAAMKKIFPQAKHLPDFLKLIDRAVALAESETDDLTAIHALGPGWCGDEALAVAIYCALKYDHDFDRALIAAVNHGGDSDSTGAITGNILGAYLGLAAIPEKYTTDLELLDVITELAEDLYYGCCINEYTRPTDPRDIAWERKYVYAILPRNDFLAPATP